MSDSTLNFYIIIIAIANNFIHFSKSISCNLKLVGAGSNDLNNFELAAEEPINYMKMCNINPNYCSNY